MAPQIAHKHHRGHGKLTLGRCLGLMLSRYTIRLPFVGTRSTEGHRLGGGEVWMVGQVWVASAG
jgi:hypothetical protein